MKLMKKIILILIFSIFSLSVFSQKETFKIENSGITPVGIISGNGNISITQDVLLRKAVKRHIEINNNKFKGYRVQIYMGSGQKAMGEAQGAKRRFLTRYGNQHGAYTNFDSPFYKVKVGDFRSKAEAMNFKSIIEKTFPNSWVVPGRVNYPVDVNDPAEINDPVEVNDVNN